MPIPAVQSFANQAREGLYLPPDLTFCSSNMTCHGLDPIVAAYHRTQPFTQTLDHFADVAGDAYLRWRSVADPRGRERVGELLMVAADLSNTYQWIARGLVAVCDQAFALTLERGNVSDEGIEYPRLIPPALVDIPLSFHERLNRLDLFHRILKTDPWVSWLERLRAQYQRSRRLLERDEFAEELVGGTNWVRAKTKVRPLYSRKERHAASRSIRKSIALFERLFGSRVDLDKFLSSGGSSAADRKPLVVEGRRYNFHLTKDPKSLMRFSVDLNHGVAPMQIAVHNKAGTALAGVCLYFPDAPLIDQVIAIMLNARNEQTEMDMLAAAHVMEATKAFYDDPVLPALKGLTNPLNALTFIENVLNYGSAGDEKRYAVREAFIRTTLPLAYRAFAELMRPNKKYLSAMRQCGQFSLWDFAFANPDALTSIKLAQEALG